MCNKLAHLRNIAVNTSSSNVFKNNGLCMYISSISFYMYSNFDYTDNKIIIAFKIYVINKKIYILNKT